MLRLFFLSVLLIAEWHVPLYAQEVSPEAWEPVSAGTVTTWTAPLCGQGEFVLQPFFFYSRTRGSFDGKGRYETMPAGEKRFRLQEQLFMQWGLTDTIELDAQALYQQNYAEEGGLKARAEGFSDALLFLRYCLAEETAPFPHLTALFQVKFPAGKYQHLDPGKLETDSFGTGSYDFGAGLIATKKIRPFVLHADLVVNFPREAKIDGVKTMYAPYLNYDLGMEYFFPKGFNLMLEFNGYYQGDTKENGGRVPDSGSRYFTVSPGVGWSHETIQVLLAYQRTPAGVNAEADETFVFTCVYTF
jgi:hypothetical protein